MVVCMVVLRLNILNSSLLFALTNLFTYDFTKVSGRGNWTEEGCTVTDINLSEGLITCECDHLTNFAIIMVCAQGEGWHV